MFLVKLFSGSRPAPLTALEEEDVPQPSQVSITIRVAQTASAIGLGVSITGAALNSLEGKRIRVAACVYTTGILTYTLWLIRRYSELRTLGENTQKLSRLEVSLETQEGRIAACNQNLHETGQKFVEAEIKDAADMKAAKKSEEDLIHQLSPLRQRVAETTKALQEAEENLKKRTLEFEGEIKKWEQQHIADQGQITKLQKEIDETLKQIQALQQEEQSLRAMIHNLTENMSTFHTENQILKDFISKMQNDARLPRADEITEETRKLSEALNKTKMTLDQLPCLYKLLERRTDV